MKKKSPALRLSLLLLSLICLVLLPSCAEARPAEQLLDALGASDPTLPNGRRYHLDAPEESEAHPSEALLAAAFGDGELPSVFAELSDGAFYFSLHDVREISLFHCEKNSTANDVERLCLERLDRLRRYWKEDAEASALLENAAVLRRGSWVLLAVTSTPEDTARIFFRLS